MRFSLPFLLCAFVGVTSCKTELGDVCEGSADCADLGEDAICSVLPSNTKQGICVTPCPCSAGEVCDVGGKCLRSCSGHDECPSGTGCYTGVCLPTCSSDSDCTNTTVCKAEIDGLRFCEFP